MDDAPQRAMDCTSRLGCRTWGSKFPLTMPPSSYIMLLGSVCLLVLAYGVIQPTCAHEEYQLMYLRDRTICIERPMTCFRFIRGRYSYTKSASIKPSVLGWPDDSSDEGVKRRILIADEGLRVESRNQQFNRFEASSKLLLVKGTWQNMKHAVFFDDLGLSFIFSGLSLIVHQNLEHFYTLDVRTRRFLFREDYEFAIAFSDSKYPDQINVFCKDEFQLQLPEVNLVYFTDLEYVNKIYASGLVKIKFEESILIININDCLPKEEDIHSKLFITRRRDFLSIYIIHSNVPRYVFHSRCQSNKEIGSYYLTLSSKLLLSLSMEISKVNSRTPSDVHNDSPDKRFDIEDSNLTKLHYIEHRRRSIKTASIFILSCTILFTFGAIIFGFDFEYRKWRAIY